MTTQTWESLTSENNKYEHRIDLLSKASTTKFFNAYNDIDWNHPDYNIAPNNPIWIRGDTDFLGATQWYKAQPDHRRSALGLQMIVDSMKLGAVFENYLITGLAHYVRTLPDGAVEFRYAMHELIEEGQHTLMFQEFINRSGLKAAKPDWLTQAFGSRIAKYGERFPELFFIFVLGGEAPIDFSQRRGLKNKTIVHPLAKRITHIHTTEEARHINFAKLYLEKNVPKLNPVRKTILATATPIIFSVMAKMMLKPSPYAQKKFQIPDAVLNEAYDHNREYQGVVRDAFADLVKMCDEIGLVERAPLIWQKCGLI